ncbi:hypothetical protein EGM51_09975 [Verrucomicrobia bacterium S94]|nr:hypothetical protein EGM51_09975 [Verrucomicrobia bacterium S94]
MDLTKTLITIACSSVTAALITLFFQNKHYKGNLIEKWISDLRNELAHLLGHVEEYRLLGNMTPLSSDVRHQIHARKQKIHLLLNDNKDQEEIAKLVDELIQKVDQGAVFQDVSDIEDDLMEKSRLLLRQEWHNISRFNGLDITLKIIAPISLFLWLGFYILDQKLCGVISDAVASGSKTYGETYGPLSFWKPIIFWCSFGVTTLMATINLVKIK